METSSYRSRAEAGKVLATAVREALPDPGKLIVLALPRGGVPVAAEVARALDAPLDLMIVRKLGLPRQPELAMGAIASGGVRVLNRDVLGAARVDEETLQEVEAREREELRRRERAYRGERPYPDLAGRTVLLVDDGVATGSTVRAAIRAARAQGPERVVVAVPVASPDIVPDLEREADAVVCPLQPSSLFAIGAWYREFPQLSDDQVRELLEDAWRPDAASGPGGAR